MASLLPALADRRARRAFAPAAPPPEELALLWQAISVAPSHGNTQATRVLLPGTDAQRLQLADALSEGNRSWAPGAPVLCALAGVPALERQVANPDGSVRELSALHAGIALGNLMAQATAMGIIAHPMAGFDEEAVRDVFAAPRSVRVLVVIAIGYPGDAAALPEDLRARETANQRRIPWERLVVRGTWASEDGENAR